MNATILPALIPALLAAAPALAQTQPIRVQNDAPLSATGLYMMASGTPDWGANVLAGQFLPPGAFISLRLGDGSGCLYDLRMVIRDGREALRRNVDVCAERVVSMALPPPPAPAVPPPAPAPGGARGRP
jgi:hypothetical protein